MTGAVSRPNTKCHRLIWSVPELPLESLPLEAVTAVSVRAFSSTEVAIAVESPTASSLPTARAWAGVAGSAEGKKRWNRRGRKRGRGMRRGKMTRMSVRVNPAQQASTRFDDQGCKHLPRALLDAQLRLRP